MKRIKSIYSVQKASSYGYYAGRQLSTSLTLDDLIYQISVQVIPTTKASDENSQSWNTVLYCLYDALYVEAGEATADNIWDSMDFANSAPFAGLQNWSLNDVKTAAKAVDTALSKINETSAPKTLGAWVIFMGNIDLPTNVKIEAPAQPAPSSGDNPPPAQPNNAEGNQNGSSDPSGQQGSNQPSGGGGSGGGKKPPKPWHQKIPLPEIGIIGLFVLVGAGVVISQTKKKNTNPFLF